MSTHDYGSAPDHGERGSGDPPGEGYGGPPGHDPAHGPAGYGPGPTAGPVAGGHGGYGAGFPPGPGPGDGYGAGFPPGADGHFPQRGYDVDPRAGYGAGFVPGGHDSGQLYGYGAGHHQDGVPYTPEPTDGRLPPQEPAAAYGVPGGDWAGHAPAQPDGWSGTAQPGTQPWQAPPGGTQPWQAPPGATQPWQAPPGATWQHPGSDAYGAPQQWAEPQASAPVRPQPLPPAQSHAYADPQSYGPPGGAEHTAVLPAIDPDIESVVEEVFGPSAPASTPGPGRSGSPIIPPGIQPAGLTAALGLLLAGGAAVGKPGLTAFLVVLQAVTAAGWFRLNGMWPARQGILLAFLGGVAADVALLAVDGGHGPLALAGTLGVWLVLVLVLQLRHHGSADERLSSLTATSASTLLAVLAACYLATATSHAGTDPVVVGAIAVAAATLIRALPLPGGEPASLVLALAAAAATALATGPATGFGGPHAALLAVISGACALIGLRVASYDFPSRFVHFTAGVALPLTAAAPLVYLLGRALA